MPAGDDFTIDLDAARAMRSESDNTPKALRFAGNVYVLPPRVPMRALEHARAERSHEFIAALLGEEQAAKFYAAEPDDLDITELVNGLQRVYGISGPESPASPR